MATYSYTRVSTTRQADKGESLVQQERKLAGYAMIDPGGDMTGNDISKLVFTILSAVAESERDRTRERVTDVKRDQRQRGRYLGGKVPYGYRVGPDGALEPVPEQQAAIRRAGELRAAGAPLRAIRAALGTEHGERLSLDALSRVLREAA
jgi:putative DNA-invertase from lambdoid prophage Rac